MSDDELQDHIKRITASGELSYENSDEFAALLDEALRNGLMLLKLDLSHLHFVDSSGLRVLIRAAMNARESGREIRILAMPDSLDHVLTLSGFRHLFTIGDVVQRAPEAAKREEVQECCFEAPRESAYCSRARRRVETFARKMGFAGLALEDVRIASGEAITNACRHGSRCDTNISIHCRNNSGTLRMTFRYPSDRFDPDSIPEPVIETAPEGGMGIYFMRRLMDRVHYEFRDGCAILTLEKKLPSDD